MGRSLEFGCFVKEKLDGLRRPVPTSYSDVATTFYQIEHPQLRKIVPLLIQSINLCGIISPVGSLPDLG